MNAVATAEAPLPEWDLSDLYPGPDSAALKADLAKADDVAADFARRFQGRIGTLSGDELAGAIRDFEGLSDLTGRIGSYAGLLHAGDMADAAIGQFYQNVTEKLTGIGSRILFFTLEINRLEDERLAALQRDSTALRHYAPWLRDIRVFRPHQLADDMERLLLEKDVAGSSAWIRLYDQTLASLRIPVEGQDLTLQVALNLLSDADRGKREAAAKALAGVFQANQRLFGHIMNTLIKDKAIDDDWRQYGSAQTFRNLMNQVETPVVEALAGAVKAAYPRLSHRYYALKARWLGLDKLEYWDRNAPLPEADDRRIPWPKAVEIVLGAYEAFSPELAAVGKRFFDAPWIDAALRPGKASGAFAHPTVPSAHPYLLVNYQGKTQDVMTLAHELGHGCHQILAGAQGPLMSATPLTLAETASVFGEQLTFRALLAGESDARRRRAMLAQKVEDMLNTVVRQIAFYHFESRLHAERREGEIMPERIGAIWREVMSDSLGPAFTLAPDYDHYWCYISHFIHAPFYVYAYAFGDCLVNSLYAVYGRAEPGFQQRYLTLLKAGGTLRHKDLLAPFGLDATDPAFWQGGLNVIAGFIDELEKAA